MKARVSIGDFFDKHGFPEVQTENFNVYRREEFACNTTFLKNNRRDFYKITLIMDGEGILSTATKAIHVKGNTLTFRNPMVPYAWEPLSDKQTGYFCLFTDAFINHSLKQGTLLHSPLFKVGADQIFMLKDHQAIFLKQIFENMFNEVHSGYKHKSDLLRSYIQIILHEALKIQPPTTYYQPSNASDRLVSLFMELLDQQFRIDAPHDYLQLRTPHDYATHLMVHINHLNKTLRKKTGKTTSKLITERIREEAKSLLLSTHWDIAEIAYCLGFKYASNFNTFFKRHVGHSPKAFRVNMLSKT